MSRHSRRLSALPVVVASAVLMAAGAGSAASAAPAVAAPTPGTIYGSTVQLLPQEQWSQGIARVESYDGHLGVVRMFQNVPQPSVLQAVGQRSGIFSFDLPPAQVLSGAYDAQFAAFFAAAPTDHPTWWNYYHEADVAYATGKITDLTQFKAASTHVAQLARAAGNHQLKNAAILLGWTANQYAKYKISQFLPDDRSLVDVIAYDNYNGGAIATGQYGDPAKMIADDASVAASLGKPFAVAEFGSVVLGSDYAGRAAWITSFSQDAAAAGAQFVAYFDSDTYGQGKDYRLLDPQSQSAYHAVVASTPDLPPAAPFAVTVTSANGGAAVAWQTPDDHGSPLTGYTVTATNTGTGVSSSWPLTPDATSATLSPLANGQTYAVSVTATSSLGTGAASAPQTVVPGVPVGVPDAPVAAAASPGDGIASLTWTPPARNGGSTVSSYTLTATDADTGVTAGTTTVGGTSTSATLSGLVDGETYLLSVAATNALGTGAPSAAASTTPFGAPGAPTVGSAVFGNGAATLSWTPPATNGGAPVTGYTINAVNPANGVVLASAAVSGPVTSGTITGLTNGRAYALTVSATNGLVGAASGRSNVVTPATLATAPVTNAFGGNYYDSVVSATAWWYAPTSNGGSAVTGYRVAAYYYVGNTLVSTTISPLQPASLRKLAVQGLVAKGTYRFAVSAVNAVGASPFSAPSALATAL